MSVDEQYEFMGEQLPYEIGEQLNLLPPDPDLSDKEFLIANRQQLDRKAIIDGMNRFKDAVNFRAHGGRWSVITEMMKFSVGKGTYHDIIEAAKKRSGENSSAGHGKAELDGNPFVLYHSNYDFASGAVGIEAGKEFSDAIDLARKEKSPLVIDIANGGMFQEQNLLALAQMPISVAELEKFKRETNLPVILMLHGQVWGGTSASIVPLADIIIGIEGGNLGFAGPKVIASYQGFYPSEGSQSVERAYVDRFVHVLVKEDEVTPYLSLALSVFSSNKKDHSYDETRFIDGESGEGRTMQTAEEGLYVPRISKGKKKIIKFDDAKVGGDNPDDPMSLYETYGRIYRDSGRVDSEFLFRKVFDKFLPTYNHISRNNKITMPPIIGGYALLNGQLVSVLGHQPNYELHGDRIIKRSSMPRPEDFRWGANHILTADRLVIPLVTFIDTLGAEPTERAEELGQHEAIAFCLRAIANFRNPALSFVIGGKGSGGGIGIGNLFPVFFALEDSMSWVAEPTSAASIVYKTDSPQLDQVVQLLSGYESRPQDYVKLGIPVKIIKTSPNPLVVAGNIYQSLSTEMNRQLALRPSKLRKEREEAIRDFGKLVLKRSR